MSAINQIPAYASASAAPATSAPRTVPAASASAASARAASASGLVAEAARSARNTRNALAGWEVKRVNAVLKALQFFGGDPAMVASRAAELARDLGAAAGDLGGSDSAPQTADTLVQAADALNGLTSVVARIQADRVFDQSGKAALRDYLDSARGAAQAIRRASLNLNV